MKYNLVPGRELRIATLWLALVAIATLSGCHRKPPTDAADALGVGKKTVGSWVIEGDELARIHPGAEKNRVLKAWNSPELTLPAGGPYTVVVFLDGAATGPGRSQAVYTLGYEGLTSAKLPSGATLSVAPRFGDEAPAGAAGERPFSKHWVAPPLRWETDQKVALSISFDEMKQLTPRRMTVFLRSGTGGMGMGWFVAGIPALIGLTMIGLWFLWFRR